MAQFAMSRQSMLWACILASMGGGAAAVAQGSMSLARPGRADAIAASFRSATLRLRGGSPTEEVMTYPSFVKDKNDFNHVIRIFNTNLPGGRTVLYSLIGIKGVGRRFGDAVIKRSGIDGTKRMGECTAEEVEKLVQVIERPLDFDIPAWMLNRRKDFATGKDMHNNTNKWDFQVKTDIERLIKMRAHRGLRHAWGYKVRGQRTKTTGRGIGKLLAASKKPGQKKQKKK
mmetsp:Transcript_53850/g.78961  ORF Transcript_53850/g.78961 Transcript_53850/m.78961 type:complete len:229 (+) Transcript_53850:148-834(+)